MAAPSSAYNTLDMIILSVAHRVAKLTGKHNTLANARTNFHLDRVFAQYDKSTGALLGFVGAVIEGGTNSKWRSSSRLSSKRVCDEVSGTKYRPLLDAGLNIQGYASGLVVKYAFCNYFRIDVTVHAAPYESVTAHGAIKQTSSTSSADSYVTSGTVTQGSSALLQMVSRSGLQYWDKAGTYAVVIDVSNSEGTRTLTGSISMLAPLNFDTFIPVSSSSSTPDKSSSDICTILIDSKAVDEIVSSVKGLSEGSKPLAIAFMQADPNVALLSEGRSDGTADETLIQNYYNYVKNGSGSYSKPANGLWVCEMLKTAHVGSTLVSLYYGIQVSNGRITGAFRAKTPVMPDIRPDLRLNIDITPLSTNNYRVKLSLVVAGTPDGKATVTINALYVRKTQTGAAMSGQFKDMTGTLVTFPLTIEYNPGGLMITLMLTLTTTTSVPFWVTANATCSSNKYKFSNPGGNTNEGGSIVTPVG